MDEGGSAGLKGAFFVDFRCCCSQHNNRYLRKLAVQMADGGQAIEVFTRQLKVKADQFRGAMRLDRCGQRCDVCKLYR